jgi:hypothetical protein
MFTSSKEQEIAMNNNSTHITVILDRTGSMESIRDDTIGGFNAFLKAQQEQAGAATLSLAQFDSQDPYEVIHNFREISTVPVLTHATFVPRACTPLLDAMGRGINDLEQNLAEMAPENRPGKVVVVIITDGHENSSREFRKDQVERMVQDKQQKLDWQFVFLSADLAGIDDALSAGVEHRRAMAFSATPKGTRAAFCAVSERIADYRNEVADEIAFSDEDRTRQSDPVE